MQESFIVPRRTDGEVAGLAYEWRKVLGVEDCWAPDIIALLEKELPERLPGFELVRQSDEMLGRAEAFARHPRIFVRETVYQKALEWDGRSRFTLTHEMGHLFLHPDTPSPRIVSGNRRAPIDEPNRSSEWQANRFAAHFLMPVHVVREFNSFEALAEHCKVSLDAAKRRFREVGHVREPLSPETLAMLA
jgi:hypothetical protein